MHILLFSFPAITERKFKKFLCYVVLAYFIHRTAVIFIPVYFFVNKRFTKNTIAVTFFGDIALAAVMPLLLKFIIFPIFAFMGKGSYEKSAVFSINNLIILMFAIMVLLFVFVDLKQCQSDVWRIILWAFAFSVFVEIAGCYVEVIGRIIQYYYICVILLIPKVLYNYKERNTKIIVSFLLVFLLLGFYMHSLSESTLVPYKVFFKA